MKGLLRYERVRQGMKDLSRFCQGMKGLPGLCQDMKGLLRFEGFVKIRQVCRDFVNI